MRFTLSTASWCFRFIFLYVIDKNLLKRIASYRKRERARKTDKCQTSITGIKKFRYVFLSFSIQVLSVNWSWLDKFFLFFSLLVYPFFSTL